MESEPHFSTSRLILAGLALTALSIVFTWPVAAHVSDSLPADLGDPLLNAWAIGWVADRLRHAFVGFWNAPIFYPYRYTLAFSEHLLGIAIPVAPIVWATGNALVAYNVAFILSFALAAVGMFILARELTGCEKAAWIAACIYAFAPARLGQIGHLQTLMSGWLPLALWALTRFVRTRSTRYVAALLLFVLAQALSNNYFAYFLLVPLSIVALHGIWRCPPGARSRLAGGLAIGAVMAVGAMMPIARAYFAVRRTYGFHRLLQDVTTFGADLGAYLHGNEGVHPPLAIWHHLPFVARPGGPEGELFPGAVALVLAAIATVFGCRRWHDSRLASVRVYTLVLLSALILSLGAKPTTWGVNVPIGGPYRAAFALLPGFDGIRVPARFSVVVQLAVAVLAGFATKIVLFDSRLAGSRIVAVAATTALTAVILLEGYGAPLPIAYLAPGGRPDPEAYDWIRQHAPGPLLELPTGDFAHELQSYRYEYQTLFHRQPIVNGASGYTPGLHAFVGGFGSPLVEASQLEDGLRMLRALGVRTVIVHPHDYRNADVGAWTVEALRAASQVSEQQRFPALEIFTLAPLNASERPEGQSARDPAALDVQGLVQIAPSAFAATASILSERIANAFDANLATRWISSKRQDGDEWIELAFDRSYDIARLRFGTSGRSLGDYPRRLAVDSIDDEGRSMVVYEGGVVFQLGIGLVADPIAGTADVWLRPNHSRRLRLRQTGTTRRWAWSIDELSVYRLRD